MRTSFLQETHDKRIKEHRTTTTRSNTNDHDHPNDDIRQEYYSEKRYHRTEHDTRHRTPSETSEFSTAHGIIDEEFKKKYLRCLAYMKLIERLYENQRETDDEADVMHRKTSRRVGHSSHIHTHIHTSYIFPFPGL
jgi:hypothetical protein